MSEQEWLGCTDPQAMLEFLLKSGRVSDRKLRLFAVACSRRMWDWIDALGRSAVDVAENYADGLAGPEELRAARLACRSAGGQAAWYAAATNPAIAARNAARSTRLLLKPLLVLMPMNFLLRRSWSETSSATRSAPSPSIRHG